MDGQMDGQTEGQKTDKWMDRDTDRQMDEQTLLVEEMSTFSNTLYFLCQLMPRLSVTQGCQTYGSWAKSGPSTAVFPPVLV